ncbi:MAG: stalk domain-containing protein [Clostridia bacterium]|nr:stalk domain-containing protein [Clostridia bacterium]
MKRMMAVILSAITIFATFPVGVNASAVEKVKYGNSSYQVFQTEMNWDEANTYCLEIGGHLATITSENEQRFIESLLTEEHQGYWLGGTGEPNSKNWKWITDEKWEYSNWDIGEPNYSGEYLQIYTNGKWDNTYNDGDHGGGIKKHGFICEWDNNKQTNNSDSFDITGKYTGTYTAHQGLTGLNLIISKKNDVYDGVFNFYAVEENPNVPNGTYFCDIDYDSNTKRCTVSGKEWLQKPDNYTFVTLTGYFSDNNTVFYGKVNNLWDFYVTLDTSTIEKIKANDENLKVIVNENELKFDQPPYIENGTTMVPMRAIFEVLGASVDYDTETKAITATKGSTVIKLFANSDTATVNGKEVTLTSPVANKNGTTMVPLRLVSEALGAEVSWDAETKVVTINLDKEVTDKMVFSSNDTSLSFKVGEDIIIGVGLDKDNVTDEELNNIKISMDDRYSVVPYDSKIVDNKKYFYFKANTEGNYSIYAENSKTGESVEIPLSINKNKTYNIGSVPTQKVDGEDVIVNNFSGMTIDNYKEEKLKNGSCNVSFDVYNTKSVYGEVEVYDSNGKIISAKPIEKNSDSATSMKGALLDNIKDLYGDIVEGTVFTYKQKSGYSKKTSVSVNIPKDGYIKITNDVKESYMVGVLNITDLCLQTKQILSVAGKTDSNMENKVAEKITSKEFLNKISEKLFENQGEFSEKVAEKLTNKIVFSADGIGNFLNSLSDIMNEADIDDIVESALIESGASIGQDVFTNVAGPAGTGLKVVFKVAEIENVILSIRHFETSLDKGAIVIQNK